MEKIKQNLNKKSMKFLQEKYLLQDDIFEPEIPKFVNNRITHPKQVLIAPWITSRNQIFEQHHSNQLFPKENSLIKCRNTFSSSGKDKIIPKNLEVFHEQYKMNSTLLEFRIKPSAELTRKNKSQLDKRSTIQYQRKYNKSPQIRSKNSISYLQKTPKIKFLQQKLKVKQCLSSKIRRRKVQPEVNSEINMNTLNESQFNQQEIHVKKCETFAFRIPHKRNKSRQSNKWFVNQINTSQA